MEFVSRKYWYPDTFLCIDDVISRQADLLAHIRAPSGLSKRTVAPGSRTRLIDLVEDILLKPGEIVRRPDRTDR
jgi:hypothetical protein